MEERDKAYELVVEWVFVIISRKSYARDDYSPFFSFFLNIFVSSLWNI
jgi:hypothetical protein